MEYKYDKVRISDIPQQGLSLSFEISTERLYERANAPLLVSSESSITQPALVFTAPAIAKVFLQAEGQTVEMNGEVSTEYTSLCGRCGEEAKEGMSLPVSLIFKPKRNTADSDDVGYALYQGDILNCSESVEELLILSLSHTIYCSEDCKGLCSYCGTNLNASTCSCERLPVEGDEAAEDTGKQSPFAKLKDYVS